MVASFGAGFASEQTGIIVNNQMSDFSSPNMTSFFGVPPSEVNYIKPGKRPLSSMAPTVVANTATGAVRMVIGAAGGTKISTGVSSVIRFWPYCLIPIVRRIQVGMLFNVLAGYDAQFVVR